MHAGACGTFQTRHGYRHPYHGDVRRHPLGHRRGRFRRTLVSGIGHVKAYGCGLLTLPHLSDGLHLFY
ncbi:type I-E CRISPR-associated protein Cas6/Cse3/CasE [Phytohabitans flavus]|uniref:type I-E CRISPR-associated protein Cas6/Cse3/CasE n=1 Tax=Phytohabitans flavus TaxID=1076124 RepID=UPI0036455672